MKLEDLTTIDQLRNALLLHATFPARAFCTYTGHRGHGEKRRWRLSAGLTVQAMSGICYA